MRAERSNPATRRQARKINAAVAASAALFSWRATRAGLPRRFAPRNDAEALRERARSLIQLSNSLRILRSPDGAQRNPGAHSAAESRIALRSIRATGVRTHVIAPCLVRPQGLPVILFLISHKGRAERQGVSPRPRRPHGLDAGSPHAAFAAHGQWPSPTPKIVELNRASEADLRLRSARGWILRLAASLTGNCRLRRPRPDRTSCRTGMHLDRPPVASASISCPTADPRLSSVIRSIQARHRSGHRIPLPRFDDDRDAPLTGAGCDRRYKSLSRRSRTKCEQASTIFSENQKSIERGNHAEGCSGVAKPELIKL